MTTFQPAENHSLPLLGWDIHLREEANGQILVNDDNASRLASATETERFWSVTEERMLQVGHVDLSFWS